MKTIVGTFLRANNTPIAGGRLDLQLSGDAVVPGTAQLGINVVSFTLDDNGSIPANSKIWTNDEILPATTTYRVTVVVAGEIVYGPENFFLSGSDPINFDLLEPVAGGIMSLGPVTALNIQSQQPTLTGNAGDQIFFTFTVPANSLTPTSMLRISWSADHVGAVAIQYGIVWGSQSTTLGGTTSAVKVDGQVTVTLGIQGQPTQQMVAADIWESTSAIAIARLTGTQDPTLPIVISLTFNVANTDTLTPQQFTAELV